MHPSALFTAALTLLTPLASAIITGIAVPSTIARNSTIPITIITANYIQSVADIAISFGLTSLSSQLGDQPFYNESVGSTLLGSLYLGPKKSNINGNISTTVDIPGSVDVGKAVFNAVLYSLWGALYEPLLKNYTVEVMVGDQTSKTVVTSPQ